MTTNDDDDKQPQEPPAEAPAPPTQEDIEAVVRYWLSHPGWHVPFEVEERAVVRVLAEEAHRCISLAARGRPQ